MFDPMELERAKIRAEVIAQQATEAGAQHKIMEGTMRLHALTPGAIAPKSSGLSWRWALVLLVVAAAVGFGAAENNTHGPQRASISAW